MSADALWSWHTVRGSTSNFRLKYGGRWSFSFLVGWLEGGPRMACLMSIDFIEAKRQAQNRLLIFRLWTTILCVQLNRMSNGCRALA